LQSTNENNVHHQLPEIPVFEVLVEEAGQPATPQPVTPKRHGRDGRRHHKSRKQAPKKEETRDKQQQQQQHPQKEKSPRGWMNFFRRKNRGWGVSVST
jgi:hypothetical protein